MRAFKKPAPICPLQPPTVLSAQEIDAAAESLGFFSESSETPSWSVAIDAAFVSSRTAQLICQDLTLEEGSKVVGRFVALLGLGYQLAQLRKRGLQ